MTSDRASTQRFPWRRALLVPTLVRAGLRALRARGGAWDRYWSSVRQTGPDGEVLWDGDSAEERDWLVGLARRAMDSALPLVDIGCGNGRYTRALAPWFTAALGVDVSAQAVARAERETRAAPEAPDRTSAAPAPVSPGAAPAPVSPGAVPRGISALPRVSFRVLDMTEAGAGARLGAEVGAANVFVRGLFHTLDAAQRGRLAESCRALVGERGTLLLVETDFPGSALAYLEFLGARGGDYPAPLLRCLEAGLPPPSRFGARELALCFPEASWEHVEAGSAELRSAAMRPGQTSTRIPAFFAVLRARPGRGSP
ncbi:methyltransferase domain-containing protein [Sorangium sp. So ce1335]|uniref:methyltransferase domain-containing protein n=1 Tax=Sorangium sp. So ce1335 TaxID=3133335 RepID=UPI003F63D666